MIAKQFLKTTTALAFLNATELHADCNEYFRTAEYRSALISCTGAAEQGYSAAQFNLGLMFAIGLGVAQDYAVAARWYRAAAEQGHDRAQNNLAWMYENGRGVAQDHADAARWYRAAAEQGYVAAQYRLGLMYRTGRGVLQDHAEAVLWYRSAADQGYVAAQYRLGRMYESGSGVAQDYAEAARWYRAAAEQGLAPAQFNLGWMHANGLGVALEYAEAVRWYRTAAEQGYDAAQHNLGWMYENGLGVAQDYVEAVLWYRSAAEQELAQAQARLGWMYENGLGVAQDLSDAVRLYRAAAEQGNSFAQSNLDRIFEAMDNEEQFADWQRLGPAKFMRSNPSLLIIDGEIQPGDAPIVQQALILNDVTTIILDSPGGVLADSLDIAEAVRDAEIDTFVPNGARCASACVYIFLGGVHRYAEGELAVHQLRARLEETTAAVDVDQVLQGSLEFILRIIQLGAPSWLIDRINSSPVLVDLSENERLELSIGVESIPVEEASAALALSRDDAGADVIDIRYDQSLDTVRSRISPEECIARLQAVQEDHGKIVFEWGSVEITDEAGLILDRIVEILPDCRHVRMEIGGHTDSQGSEELNLNLSQARADSVLNGLLARNVLVSNLIAQGYGESQPIADNGTEEGREQNRRIAFRLLSEAVVEQEALETEEELAEAAARLAELAEFRPAMRPDSVVDAAAESAKLVD